MSGKLQFLCFVTVLFLLSGCQSAQIQNQPDQGADNSDEDISWSQIYDSEDTGIFIGLNEEEQTISMKKIDSGEKIEIGYTGGTNITDKYESTLAIKQLQMGDIINIYYNQADFIVRKIELSPEAWEYTQVENLTYDQTEKMITIAGVKYRYGDSFTLISNGEEINLLDLNTIDIVTVKGLNKKIYSVEVTRGHGYISLENDETFIGGWIEVGQESAKPITEDMFVLATEGNHKVTVAKDGAGGTKNVTVRRNEKTIVDVGDLKSETPKSGSLKFKITPSGATLYIDGVITDYSELVVLDYGIHRLIVRADGYSDYSQTLVVGSTYAEIEINAGTSSNTSSDSDSESSETSSDTSTDSSNSSQPSETTSNTNQTGLTQPGISGTNGLSDGTTSNSTGTTDTTDSTNNAVTNALTDVLSNILTD